MGERDGSRWVRMFPRTFELLLEFAVRKSEVLVADSGQQLVLEDSEEFLADEMAKDLSEISLEQDLGGSYFFRELSGCERLAVHSLGEFLGLNHRSSKSRSGKYDVVVSKSKEYVLPQFVKRFPETLWEFDVFDESAEFEKLGFQEAMQKSPEIYTGLALATTLECARGGNFRFSPDLSKAERAIVYRICAGLGISCRTWRGPSVSSSDLIEFVEVHYLKDVIETRGNPDTFVDHNNFRPGIGSSTVSLPALLLEIYERKYVEDSLGNRHKLEAGIMGKAGRFLHWLIQKNPISKTLEVGFAYGISGLYIYNALLESHKNSSKEFHHYAIDPFQHSQWNSIGLLNMQRANFSQNFSLLTSPSDLALPNLLSAGHIGTFDLILIDGNHLFDYAFVDLYYSSRLLVPGGFVVLDDSDMPSIRKLVQFVLRNFRHLEPYPPGCFDRTFTFCKRSASDPRPWLFHCDF